MSAYNNQQNEFKIEPCDSVNFNDQKYKKLDLSEKQAAQMNMLVSQMPNVIAVDALSNAYKLTIPSNLENVEWHFMQLKDNSGFTTDIVSENNRIIAKASLSEINPHTVALGIFSIMSVAVGQYFLAQINSNIDAVTGKVDEVLGWLYDDKYAELSSEINFAQYACRHYSSIMEHDEQRIATISGLQNSRKIAVKDIEFYMNKLKKQVSKYAKSYREIESISEAVFKYYDCLNIATNLYLMSYAMEAYYAQNSDVEYIQNLKSEMIHYMDKCDKKVLEHFSTLKGRLGEFKPNAVVKFGNSVLKKKIEEVQNSLNTGDDSDAKKTIESLLDGLTQSTECYLSSSGEMFIEAK